MAVTMREVARAAGVSTATVSFVVNNTKRVNPGTRERIEKAMADLGFRPNMVARALASRRTQILALVYPALEHRMASAMEFVNAAAQAASLAGYHLVVWPVGYDGAELAGLVGQQLVDGVLLMEVQMDDPRVAALRELDIPFALIGRTAEISGLACVDIDFDETVRLALDHLTGLGHEEIVFINGSQETASFARYGPWVRLEDVYRTMTAERGLPTRVLHSEPTVASGRAAAAEVLAAAPHATAVIMVDVVAGAGLVAELHRLGRDVPQKMSVMSIMSSLDQATMCNPPMTVVTAPGTELGRLGVDALLRLLDGGEPLPPTLRSGVLVVAESTAPRRRVVRRRRAVQV